MVQRVEELRRIAVRAGRDLHIGDSAIGGPHPPVACLFSGLAGGLQPLVVGHIHNAADGFKSGILGLAGFVAAHPADATDPSSDRRERHRESRRVSASGYSLTASEGVAVGVSLRLGSQPKASG